MLMIAPLRWVAMSLLIRRQVRKTEVKLTARTSSHASSFIRMIKPSRVMPALLTSTSTVPACLTTASSAASTLLRSAISQLM
jgi:hypothetical protein